LAPGLKGQQAKLSRTDFNPKICSEIKIFQVIKFAQKKRFKQQMTTKSFLYDLRLTGISQR